MRLPRSAAKKPKQHSVFSDRTNWELTPNKLTTLLDELRRKNVPLYDLTESNPTHCGFSYPPGILSALTHPKNLEYAPQAQGMLNIREAVCAYYKKNGIAVKPEQVFLTASTSEAYFFLFRLLLNPNERVLFPAPSYPLFQFLVDLNDIQMETYPLVYEEGWQIDLKGLANKIPNETRAMVVVNPNNPTGSYVKPKELAVMNGICSQNQMALISDEVFFDYSFDATEKKVSLIANNKNLTFVLGGLSKTLGLPQMKLAWIVVNGPSGQVRNAIERLEVIADTYLSVNTPVQNAVPEWFNFQFSIQDQIRTRTKRNWDYILKVLPKDIECLAIEGGWYAVLKLPEQIDEETFTLELLQEDHVYIHPGYFFDFVEAPYAVVSLIPPEDIFQEGFRRLVKRAA